jgi:hypothetical protein
MKYFDSGVYRRSESPLVNDMFKHIRILAEVKIHISYVIKDG